MDESTQCLTKTTHEKVEYSYSKGHTDVFVCACCGREFEEKADSSG